MISVIIPVYNIEKYIEVCVESVLSQSYRDLQIILTDDGSTDQSGAICDVLAKKDDRIQVIHQSNRGLSAARNVGLASAKGEYIAFVDGDDQIHPDMLKVLYDIVCKTDCDIVQCEHISFDGSLPDAEYYHNTVTEYGREAAMRELIHNRVFRQTVWNKLYKRSCLENLCFAEGKYHEDEFFTWQAFLRAQKICATNFIGYYYLTRQGSIMGTAYSEKRLDALEAIAERTEFFKENMPVLYSASAAALLENCIYQYQCLLKSPDFAKKEVCKENIIQYMKKTDLQSALSVVGGKQKMWFRMFYSEPEKTAALRNRLNIGF